MKSQYFRVVTLIFFMGCSGILPAQSKSGASIQFDQNVTPDTIFGSGNANGAFTTVRQNGIELGIRGKLRFDENGQSAGIYNSNGDGTYTFRASAAPGRPQNTADWNFDWSVNVDFDNSSNFDLADLTYEFGLDGDPGSGTDFFTFDPITLDGSGNFPDHAIGDNATGNGDGDVATDEANYQLLIDNNNVAQNSWRYAFFPLGPLADFNAKLEGTYDIYLAAFDNGVEVARTTIQIIMVNPDLEFDQDATPDAIFGSGNANGAFTTDRRNGIETALRAKLRFNAMGQPENTFNSNGDGTYSFDAGQAPGQSMQTAVWGFEWSVNTDFVSNPAVSSDLVLSDLTYELGLDGDPAQSTDFLVFDNITPSMEVPFFDHAIGDNTTGNGDGTVAADESTYQMLIDNNNVAQNSWRYAFFLDGALMNFDPTVDGTYTIYMLARDMEGTEVSRTQIQVLVGPTAVAGDVADVSISKMATAMGAQIPGDSFDYELTVTSEEVATATSVMVMDTLPDNVSFDSGSCDDGSMAMQSGQDISFDLGDLDFGDTVVCTISVTVSGSGLISNTATVNADNDTVAGNNSSTVVVRNGLIESVGQTGDTPTPTDNDYTRINNAVQAAQSGDVLQLSGTFDWGEANALNSWEAGSNGAAGEGGIFQTGGDDYSILLPEGLNDFTVTAATQGDAVVQGPGDLVELSGEAFLIAFSADNQNIEVSNLVVNDFDLSIGFFFAGGGVNVYDNFTFINNLIRVPTDIVGADEAFQNIGLHFSFGDNSLISDNTFEIPGDGAGDGVDTPASIAMQSNTSSGAYEGLIIENNIIQVLNAQSADPEFVLGIWENSNAFQRDIIIRDNVFENMSPMNDPATNLQVGFRITSQRNETLGVGAVMSGNSVDGANIGYQWLPGRFGADWTARDPLTFTGNAAINGETGVVLDSNGSGVFLDNDFSGNVTGIDNITADNIVSDATCNWWGAANGPSGEGTGDGSAVSGFVTFQPWNISPTGPCEGGFDVDVSIVKSADVSGLTLPGDTFNYMLSVSNDNAAMASAVNVMVSDTLPDNLTFNSGSCDDGSMANQNGQTISFDLQNLADDATTVCTINVTVNASGQISNTATVTADNDTNAANDSSTLILGSALVESVTVTGDDPTPTDNDYTRINNAVQAVGAGDTIMLVGLFDWRETNAFNSWSAGSNGIPGEGGLFETGGDDFSILVPEGSGDFTITAASQGDAIVQGPGDLGGLDGEAFLVVFSPDNQNIEISNLVVNDFDLSIGFFFAGGGINVYDNSRILNNRILMATDIAGNSTAGEGFQNIGLHFSFGDNISIASNLIEIPGDGMSQRPALSASSVAMQSNTSGNAYDGLVIEDNIVRVLNAQSSDPESVLGFWENSNSFGSDVQIRNNRFENMSPDNDPALNLQSGFRITSQTDPMTGDGARMSGNFVDGANIGYEWLPGRFNADFSARGPVIFTANTAINTETGIRLDSNGSAVMACNRIANNTVGIDDVTLPGIDADVQTTGEDNWWGCNAGPNMGLCDSIDSSANVSAATWLVATLTADPDSVQVGGMSDLTLDVTRNNNAVEVTDCTLPDGVPVAFATDIGNVTPVNTDTVAGMSPAVFTAPASAGTANVIATIDNEMAPEQIVVLGEVMITAVDPDPLPGNASQADVTVTGVNFIPETVILADGLARTTTFINSTTVMVRLIEDDLDVMGSGTIDLVADNTAVAGGGQSAPFTVDIVSDLQFRDGFEDPML